MSEVAAMRNLGQRSAEMLSAAGISTCADLVELGPVKAYLAVRQAGGRPSKNLMWAIAGAIDDIDWRAVNQARKQELLAELHELEGVAS